MKNQKQSLPLFSFVTSVLNDETMMIFSGQRGYYPLTEGFEGRTAAELNEMHELTPEQVLSMEVGALYGWDEKGANPNYHVKNHSIAKINGTYKEVSLPAFSFVTSVLDNETMMIFRGEQGYHALRECFKGQTAEELNKQHDITPEQDLAMQVGALYSWNEKGANPMYHVKNNSIAKINGTRKKVAVLS